MIQPGEKVCTGIDRLNGIVLTSNARSSFGEVESSTADCISGAAVGDHLMREDPTYDDVVSTCKKYDRPKEQQKMNLSSEIHLNTVTEKVVCSYPKCGKSGHIQAIAG